MKSVSKKLEFAIMLGLFFPVLLEALFTLNKNESSYVSGMVLKSGIIIAFLIGNYLIFQATKEKLSKNFLTALSWIYTLNIICFAVVVLFMAYVDTQLGPLSLALAKPTYAIAFNGYLWLPSVGLILLLGKWFSSLSVFNK